MLDPAHARFRFFESITAFLTHVALASPLVLILDDLQWVDTPSLLLLQFLVRQLPAMRVMVVGTYRDTALPASHPLRTMLGTVGREPVVLSLALHGLSAQAVAQCLERTTGVAPTAALATAVYRRTEGHPFFLTELLRLLTTTGTATDPYHSQVAIECSVPQRVRQVVSRRLQALSAGCQQFLCIAAIVGRDFRLPVVAAVAAQAHPPLQHPLLDLLDEALVAQLITEVPQRLWHYRFTHALIREVLHEELPLRVRVRLHQQVGEALEHLCRPHLEPYLSELATHFRAAAQGGAAVEQAITYTLQAAQRATTLLAYEEAAQYYTQALQLLALHPTDAVSQCEVLLALGDAQR
jgi:predicted ATPase